MPSSNPTSVISTPSAASAGGAPRAAHAAHFEIIPFRRDDTGAIVPGTAMEASNGDLAWRRARAAAREHGNVGAVELKDGVLLAWFGDVNLDALPH